MTSPYEGYYPQDWMGITHKLINEHPLNPKEIVEVVLKSWNSIFDSKIGSNAFQIGKDIFPKPQIMGFLLHELIPLEFSTRYPYMWRGEKSSDDKDIVFIPDDKYSIEVKTSSDPSHVFGNRSYAQATLENRKVKSGYYLTVNFGKFTSSIHKPKIYRICFGWLDITDWIGQKAASGQQARLSLEVERNKLIELFSEGH